MDCNKATKSPIGKRRSFLPARSRITASRPLVRKPRIENSKFKLGDRVLIGGIKHGTLRYYGRCHFAAGDWCGIELDEPEGKHDGTVDCKQYFRCVQGHGIFAPCYKVEASIFDGDDYANDDDSHAVPDVLSEAVDDVAKGDTDQPSQTIISSAVYQKRARNSSSRSSSVTPERDVKKHLRSRTYSVEEDDLVDLRSRVDQKTSYTLTYVTDSENNEDFMERRSAAEVAALPDLISPLARYADNTQQIVEVDGGESMSESEGDLDTETDFMTTSIGALSHASSLGVISDTDLCNNCLGDTDNDEECATNTARNAERNFDNLESTSSEICDTLQQQMDAEVSGMSTPSTTLSGSMTSNKEDSVSLSEEVVEKEPVPAEMDEIELECDSLHQSRRSSHSVYTDSLDKSSADESADSLTAAFEDMPTPVVGVNSTFCLGQNDNDLTYILDSSQSPRGLNSTFTAKLNNTFTSGGMNATFTSDDTVKNSSGTLPVVVPTSPLIKDNSLKNVQKTSPNTTNAPQPVRQNSLQNVQTSPQKLANCKSPKKGSSTSLRVLLQEDYPQAKRTEIPGDDVTSKDTDGDSMNLAQRAVTQYAQLVVGAREEAVKRSAKKILRDAASESDTDPEERANELAPLRHRASTRRRSRREEAPAAMTSSDSDSQLAQDLAAGHHRHERPVSMASTLSADTGIVADAAPAADSRPVSMLSEACEVAQNVADRPLSQLSSSSLETGYLPDTESDAGALAGNSPDVITPDQPATQGPHMDAVKDSQSTAEVSKNEMPSTTTNPVLHDIQSDPETDVTLKENIKVTKKEPPSAASNQQIAYTDTDDVICVKHEGGGKSANSVSPVGSLEAEFATDDDGFIEDGFVVQTSGAAVELLPTTEVSREEIVSPLQQTVDCVMICNDNESTTAPSDQNRNFNSNETQKIVVDNDVIDNSKKSKLPPKKAIKSRLSLPAKIKTPVIKTNIAASEPSTDNKFNLSNKAKKSSIKEESDCGAKNSPKSKRTLRTQLEKSDQSKDELQITSENKLSNVTVKRKVELARGLSPQPRRSLPRAVPQATSTPRNSKEEGKEDSKEEPDNKIRKSAPKGRWNNVMSKLDYGKPAAVQLPRTAVAKPKTDASKAQSSASDKSKATSLTAEKSGVGRGRPVSRISTRSSLPRSGPTSATADERRKSTQGGETKSEYIVVNPSVVARRSPSTKLEKSANLSSDSQKGDRKKRLRRSQSSYALSTFISLASVTSQISVASQASRQSASSTRRTSLSKASVSSTTSSATATNRLPTKRKSLLEPPSSAKVPSAGSRSSGAPKPTTPNAKTTPRTLPYSAARKSIDGTARQKAPTTPRSAVDATAPPAARSNSRSAGSSRSSAAHQPDVVTNSVASGAQQEITRLEALCENRTKSLHLASMRLKACSAGYEAMTVLVKYMSEQLDAFSCPAVKEKLERMNLQYQDAVLQLESLREEKRTLEVRVAQLQEAAQLQRAEAAAHLAQAIEAAQAAHKDELTKRIREQEDAHENQIKGVRQVHDVLVKDIKEQSRKEQDSLRRQHDVEMRELEEVFAKQREEMNLHHDEQLKEITERFENIKVALSEKVEFLKNECDQMRLREKTYMDTCQREAEMKVQMALASYSALPQEIESLRTVVEMRNQEIHRLRNHEGDLQNKVQELHGYQEKCVALQQKIENLEAVINIKADYEKQLTEKQNVLIRKIDKESKVNKRLSMENEELVYRMSMTDVNSPDIRRQISRSPTNSEPGVPRTPDSSRKKSRSQPSPKMVKSADRDQFFSTSPRHSEAARSPRILSPRENPMSASLDSSNLRRTGTYDLLDHVENVNLKEEDAKVAVDQ